MSIIPDEQPQPGRWNDLVAAAVAVVAGQVPASAAASGETAISDPDASARHCDHASGAADLPRGSLVAALAVQSSLALRRSM
jgi:hypothetical protein